MSPSGNLSKRDDAFEALCTGRFRCTLLVPRKPATSYTEGIFQMMEGGAEAYVPFIWPLEMANVLTLAERRKTLTIAQTTSFLRELQQWPIHVDSAGLDRAFYQILAATRTHKLSAYDAAYLELALREALPLATLDKDLSAAAKRAGIRIAGINPVV